MQAPFELQPNESVLNFCPGGIIFAEGLNPSAQHRRALAKLHQGLTKSARLEKIHHKENVYSLRASHGARVMGVKKPNAEGKMAFYVFAFFDKHEYDALKFINLNTIKYTENPLESKAQQLIEQGLVQTNWRPTHYINHQLICFNAQQEGIINTKPTALPVIITGAAGSGKTLIILQIMRDFVLNNPGKKCVYLATTEHLAGQANKIFADLMAHEEPKADVGCAEFFFMEQFIRTYKQAAATLVNQEDILAWLAEEKSKYSKNKLAMLLLTQPEKLVEEFKIIASLSHETEYAKLGQHQCVVHTADEKKLSLTLYKDYCKTLKTKCQLLFPSLSADCPRWDLMLVDEAQAMTINQLITVTERALDGRFMVYGDPLQNFHNTISVFPTLKSLLELNYKRKNPLINLQVAYRNPQPVIALANDIIRLRRLFVQGITDECESHQLTTNANASDAHPVEWISTLSKAKKEELKTVLNKPNALLITNDPLHLAEAKQLFNDPVILYPDQAQGLEAETVVLYYLLSTQQIKGMNACLKEANLIKDYNHLPSKNNTGTSEFTSALNRLFTAVTRVAQNHGRLVIYLGEHKKHDSEHLFKFLQQSLNAASPAASSLTPVPEKTQKDWERWVQDLYRAGNKDEAKAVYLKHVSKDEQAFQGLIQPFAPVATATAFAQPPIAVADVAAVKQGSNTHKKITLRKNSTSPKNVALVPLKFSEKDLYIHKLLSSCTTEKLKMLFKSPSARGYLFNNYIQPNGQQNQTLFQALLKNEASLDCLYQLVCFDYFNTKPIADEASKAFADFIETLKDSMDNVFELAILDCIIEQNPAFVDVLNEEQLSRLLKKLLDPRKIRVVDFSLRIITNIQLRIPKLLDNVFLNAFRADKKHALAWYIQLLKSREGCGIIVNMLDSHKLFDLHGLKNHAGEIEANGTSLFFWLTTSVMGQVVFHLIFRSYPDIGHALNGDVMLSNVTLPGDPAHGTNMMFWLHATDTMSHKDATTRSVYIEHLLTCIPESKQIVDRFTQQRFDHPQYPGCRIKGADLRLVTYNQYERCSKEFIPLMPEETHLNVPAGRYFKPSVEQKKLFESVMEFKEDDPLLILIQLSSLLDSPSAENLLFDTVIHGDTILFAQLLKNKVYYELFLSLLSNNETYCKIFSLTRLKQFMKCNSNYVSTVLFASLQEPENAGLFSILLKHNPVLIEQIHREKMLFTPNLNSLSNDNLFTTLLENGQGACLTQLIREKDLTPEFFNELFSSRLYYLREKKNHFTALIESECVLILHWFNLEPRALHYIRYEHLFPVTLDKRTRSNPFIKLLELKFGLPIINKILQGRPDIAKQVTVSDLFKKTPYYNSYAFLLSESEAKADLFKKLLMPQNLTTLTPLNFYENDISTSKGDANTLVRLMQSESGLDILLHLMSETAFRQAFDVKQLEPLFSEKAITSLLGVCNTKKGLYLLTLIFSAHPDFIPKLTDTMLYGTMENNSILVHFSKTIDLSKHSTKVLARFCGAAGDFRGLVASSIISSAYKKLLLTPWLRADEHHVLRASIQNIIHDLGKKGVVESAGQHPSLSPEQIVKDDEVSIYVNRLLDLCESGNAERMLTNLLQSAKSYYHLVTPYKNKRTQTTETLFETLIKDPTYLPQFNTILLNDRFLASGKIIQQNKTIHFLMQELPQSAKQNDLLILLSLFLSNQPTLSQEITPYLQKPEYLSIFTTNKLGTLVLDEMIRYSPDLFKELINRWFDLDKETNADWLTPLLFSKTGCGIIIDLFSLNPKFLECFNPNRLIAELKSNNTTRTPLLFWLSATKKGGDFLYLLLQRFPDFMLKISADNLMDRVLSDNLLYTNTSTLFWLHNREEEFSLLADFKARGVLTQAKIDSAICNPLQKKPFAKMFPVIMPYHYYHLNYGGYHDPDKLELNLIAAYIKTPNKKSLKNILEHPKAEYLLFDYLPGTEQILFKFITEDSESMIHFVELLVENKNYYRIFSAKRLNQAMFDEPRKNTLLIIFYFMALDDNFLKNVIAFNPNFKEYFTTRFLINPINRSTVTDVKFSVLDVLLSRPGLSNTLTVLDKKQVLTPDFAAALFRFRPVKDMSDVQNYPFSFARLCEVNIQVALSLLQQEPRIANYVTEEHLLLCPNKNGGLNTPWLHTLSTTVEGSAILNMLCDANSELLANLTLTDFIAHSDRYSSIFYNLSRTDVGHQILVKLLVKQELFPEITPDMLKEINYKQEHVTDKQSILELLCVVDEELSVLRKLISNPNFLAQFKPQGIVKNALNAKNIFLLNEVPENLEDNNLANPGQNLASFFKDAGKKKHAVVDERMKFGM